MANLICAYSHTWHHSILLLLQTAQRRSFLSTEAVSPSESLVKSCLELADHQNQGTVNQQLDTRSA